MSIHSRVGRKRLIVLGAALAAALALPAAALADTTEPVTIQPAVSRDATITITSTAVTARLIVNVRVDFVCLPFQSRNWETGETIETTAGEMGGEAVVLQVQGRTIVSGVGSFSGTVTCDGTTVNHLTAAVTARNAPWRTGTAVIGASVYAADTTSYQDSDYASTGALPVKLGR